MLCPKCNYEIIEESDTISDAMAIEAHEPTPELAESSISYKLALRFSVNQFIILCGCALLLVALNFNFSERPTGIRPVAPVVEDSLDLLPDIGIVVPVLTWAPEPITVTGFNLMFDFHGWNLGWGLGIFYVNVMELLAPLVAVAIMTIASKKLTGSNLLILGISVMGLLNGLARLMSIGWHNSGPGLQAFVCLWVIITVCAFFEYEGIHPLEGRFQQPTRSDHPTG